MRIKILIVLLCTALITSIFFIVQKYANDKENDSKTEQNQKEKKEEKEYTSTKIIESGKTYGVIMEEIGIPANTAFTILESSKNIYDLSTIRAEKTIFFTFDIKTNELIRLMYPINDEEELYVNKDITTSTQSIWTAEKKKIEYDVKIKTIKGEISSSLYEDGLKLGIDDGTIIEFAEMFEYAIDYAYDIRVGDVFTFIVEERYRNGAYAMPGRILAGKFINSEKNYYSYYFIENEDNKGYFDEKGNSIQKMFLRAPLAFKYISSGFTTGKRFVAAFNVSTGHRAIDYAASAGTPIRAVGDGTVSFAGWSTAGYGNLTSIRHNSTYSTNYAHQSKIIVKKGQRIKQGQVIGYVGSTGFSTGPHLHYEMVKNGVKINPLKEILPPGKPLKEESKERFEQEKEKYSSMIE